MNLVAGRLQPALVQRRIAQFSERLSATWKMAELVHPERPLSRGFARVTNRSGRTIGDSAAARSERHLTLRFADGTANASIDDGDAKPAVERKPRRPYIAAQPGLFDPAEE
jgi:exodeoxyribonuclease VII large subunit